MSEKTKKYLFILWFLPLLFRLYYGLNHVYFDGDTARDAYLMEQFKNAHQLFISYGPKASVWNFYLPPFYYQLQYFISWLTGFNPMGIQIFTLIIESFTPLIFFAWLKMIFSEKTSVISAFFFAFFWIIVTSSTHAWNPHMIMFFSTLVLYLWFRLYLKNEKWTIIPGCISVVIAFQLHYQSVVIIPFTFLVMILSIRKKPSFIFWWIVGWLIALIPFVPYVLKEMSNNWQNTRLIIEFFSTNHKNMFDRVSKISYFTTFIPEFIERAMMGQNTRYIFLGRILFFGGFFLLCFSAIKKNIRFLVILYFLSVLTMLRLYKGDKLDYYMLILYTLPAVLLAIFYEYLPKITIVVITIILAVSASTLSKTLPFNKYQVMAEAMDYLSKNIPEKKANIVFHDPNLNNIFAYGFLKWGFTFDPQAKTLIEVCKKTGCETLNTPPGACAVSRSNTYVALLKSQVYTISPIVYRNEDFIIRISKINQPLKKTGYSPYTYSSLYGTDLIILNNNP